MPALTYWQQFSLLLLQETKPLFPDKIFGFATADACWTGIRIAKTCPAMREKAWLLFLECIAAYFFFFGARTMIIWRPSIFGNCSTWPNGSRSAFRRSNTRMPISW